MAEWKIFEKHYCLGIAEDLTSMIEPRDKQLTGMLQLNIAFRVALEAHGEGTVLAHKVDVEDGRVAHVAALTVS